MPREREKLAPHHILASSQAEPPEAVARVARARRTRAVRTHRASTNTGHATPREGGQTKRRKPENQTLVQGHHGCTRYALENRQTLRSAISGNGHARQAGRIRMSPSARDGCPSCRDSTDGMTCPVTDRYLALDDGPPNFPPGYTCPVVLGVRSRCLKFSHTGVSPSMPGFPTPFC